MSEVIRDIILDHVYDYCASIALPINDTTQPIYVQSINTYVNSGNGIFSERFKMLFNTMIHKKPFDGIVNSTIFKSWFPLSNALLSEIRLDVGLGISDICSEYGKTHGYITDSAFENYIRLNSDDTLIINGNATHVTHDQYDKIYHLVLILFFNNYFNGKEENFNGMVNKRLN